MASGGKSFSKFDFSLNDRLYINDGKQNFSLKMEALQFDAPISTSVVSAYDFDQDGDLDVFIGERFQVETYGVPTSGYILENQGNNKFKLTKPKSLQNIGLITDAEWTDLNNDGIKDLIIVGEWMPVSIFINNKGTLENKTIQYGLENTSGFWKTIKVSDINGDGHLDLLVGNKGTNSFFKEGTRMYVSDFDENGTVEQIICHKIDDKYYPILDRDELISQIASLKQKLLYYKDYAHADIETIFSKAQLDKAIKVDINLINSSLFINNKSKFIAKQLPHEIQYSNVEAIEVLDANNDGYLDLLFGGNQYLIKPQFGRQDASQGWLVYGNSKIDFKKVVPLKIKGQIRDFYVGKTAKKRYILTTINNDSIKFYEVN